MRYALISNTLLFLVAFGAALSPLAWGQSRRSVRRPVQHKPMRQAPPPPVSIGISSFRQTVGTTETESLGIGITDSLANALKGSANLAVAGPEVLFAASEKQDIDPSKNDENAVRV